MFSKFLTFLVLIAVLGFITAAGPKSTKKPVSSPSKKPVTGKPSKAPIDKSTRIINTDFIPYPLNSYIPIKGPNGKLNAFNTSKNIVII